MSNYGGWPGRPGQPGPGGWVYAPPPPKPGVIPLHPLTIADVLHGILGTVRRYFWAVYGPITLVVLVSGAFAAGTAALIYSPLRTFYTDIHSQGDVTTGQDGEIAAYVGGVVLLYLICAFCWYAVASLTTAATLRHAVIGRRATMRQIVAEALPGLWRTLGALGLIVLVGGGALLVASVAFVLLSALAGSPGATLGLLLLLAALGWMFFLAIRLALLVPVVVLENQGVKDAFSRAWRLNERNWWRTFGFTLTVSLIGSVVSNVVSTPISVLTSSSTLDSLTQDGHAWTVADLPPFGSFWLYLVGLLVTAFVGSLLVLPLVPLCNGLLYIDRRIRRESLDEQLAAEAGISLSWPPAAPQPGYGGWPGQPAYGQPPYSGWPGQQPPPMWPGAAQPPVPPAPPQDSTGGSEPPA